MEGYWSEGNVFVIVGMTTNDNDLLRKGFSMILDGHELAQPLVDIIYRKLIEQHVMLDPGHRDPDKLKEWMPDWVEELQMRLRNERAEVIEDLLASLPKAKELN